MKAISSQLTKQNGFTLLELLVVIGILALVVALVSPLAASRVDHAKARSEFLSIKSSLKLQSLQSFTRGVSTQISLKESDFISQDSDGKVKRESFNFIEFPEQQFVINANGYPSVGRITVIVNAVERYIEFHEIIGADKEAVYAE